MYLKLSELRNFMNRIVVIIIFTFFSCVAVADKADDHKMIKNAVLDYIESQQNVKPDQMRRGLDKKLVKKVINFFYLQRLI